MIDVLRPMAIFAAVAEAGSFTAAAKKLRLTTSVVSHHVSKLEERLDVALLYRSTRSLSLTDEGRKLLRAAQAMMLAAEGGLEQVSEGGGELAGMLRLTMPAFMFNSVHEKAIWNFAAMHPNVVIDLHSSDRQVDLIGGGFDVAIRLSETASSALRMRRLGSFERKLVCAPSYLELHGPIRSIDDLKKCNFVEIDMLPGALVLERDGQTVEVSPQAGRIRVNSIVAAHAAVLNGLAIQRLPASHVESDLRLGRLVEPLPDWSPPKLAIYAVWPETRGGNLSRRFVEFLASTADRQGARQ